MKKQKVLILDVETSPVIAYIWELGEQYVSLDQIHTDWQIMAWSAKWLEEPDNSIQYYDSRNSKDDKAILKPLWELLNQADIVITQNGKKFDSKKINARLMLQGFPPPKPYRHIDTYLLVKQIAAHTSNRLEYLTAKFCKKHKKVSHKKFPGLKLWKECLKGNKEAWNEMKFYNIKDVLSTEELYLAIRAWAPESMPKVFDVTDKAAECGVCGHMGQMKVGAPRRAKTYSYRQNSCRKCGAWQTAERIR